MAPAMDPKDLASLDPALDMKITVGALKGALATIPATGALGADHARTLELVVLKLGEAETYFDRPVDEPAIYERVLAIAKAAGRGDIVSRFGKRVAQIQAYDYEFKARLQAFFGASTRAVGLFAKAVELTPEFKEAKAGLQRAQNRVSKAKAKLAALKAKAEAARTDPKAWTELGGAQADIDQLDAALASFDVAVKAAPQNVAITCKRAGVLAVTGRLEEANAAFRSALAIDPGSLNGKRGLNYTNYLQGKQG